MATNQDNIITRNDLLKAISSLSDDLSKNPESFDDMYELNTLRDLLAEARPIGTYFLLIRDSHFEDYARDTANGIGQTTGWPYDYIDWSAAATSLKQDYASIDFEGVTYWVCA